MPIEAQTGLEIARFFASGPTPEEILAFHSSDAATERFYLLIEAEKNGTITADEKAELDRDIQFEYVISLVKVEARKRLSLQAS